MMKSYRVEDVLWNSQEIHGDEESLESGNCKLKRATETEAKE